MKKYYTIISMLFASQLIFAQARDYRTPEDGLNKLLSQPEFIEDVMNLGASDFSAEKLNGYLSKYVPEYTNFKIGNTSIDFSKVYYANAEGASTDVLANLFGGALNLNANQTQNLKNVFSGNLSYTPTNAFSSGLATQLYDRGKNVKLDYALDLGVDFFQNKFGDGGITSSLIDIGGGLIGNLVLSLNQQAKERAEEDWKKYNITQDQSVFTMGILQEAEGNIFTGAKLIDKTNKERLDLQLHYKARKSMPNNTGVIADNIDFEKAINLLTEAIEKYKQNPERSYYMYLAYVDRGMCKMQIGAYRAAIIDYYFAQKILETILSGKLPDNSMETTYPTGYFDASNKNTYLKGKSEQKIGTLSTKDLANVVLNRAFAKYRAEDYAGTISDARLAAKISERLGATYYWHANSFKDVSKALEAMAEFKSGRFNEAFNLFSTANLNDAIIKDSDNDGITDFSDAMDNNNMHNFQAKKESGTPVLYGFPNYFPFDIVQIRGLSYFKADKINEAIRIYENIVSSENSSPFKTFTKVGGDISAVNASLASFYFKKGDYQKAISLLDQAISLNPGQLEYYFKRGSFKKANNLEKEAAADFEIVRNPAVLKEKISRKQSTEYYNTKCETALASNDKEAVFNAIKEAIVAYPDNESFYVYALKYLNTSRNHNHASELAQLYEVTFPVKYHILKSLGHSFYSDIEREREEIFKAFEKGASFYMSSLDIHPEQRILLQQRPYYCDLLLKFVSRENNSFIPLQFDIAKTEKMIDSIYQDLERQYSASKLMRETLEKQKQQQKAKSLGHFEQYLKLLESQKMLLDISPIHALEYVEVLCILDRDKEAIAFAKKVNQKGKMMKANELDPNSRFANAYFYGLKNIAEGSCQ